MTTLMNKFYVELSFTIDPEGIAFGVDQGDESISVFKDEGGVGVAVPVETGQLGIALNMAIIKARKHLGTGKQPWRVTLLDSEGMEKHYSVTPGVLPTLAPPVPVAA